MLHPSHTHSAGIQANRLADAGTGLGAVRGGDFKISRFSHLDYIISADTAAACIDPAGDKILPFADFLSQRRLAAANLNCF